METISPAQLQLISGHFFDNSEAYRISPFGDGHIHGTYLAENDHSFILQQINHHIFPNIDDLMHNIGLVTGHLRDRTLVHHMDVLQLHPTKAGNTYFSDPETGCWRMFHYIPDSIVYDRPTTPAIAEEGGRAFALFNLSLKDLDTSGLRLILPGFHDLELRHRQYREALAAATADRLRESGPELRAAEMFYGKMSAYFLALKDPAIPLRVTHNDTKFNNVLFDRQGRAICVIDLDTVMPGYLAFDYGDALRTLANSTDEDERDSCRVRFDFRLFQAFTRGYIPVLSGILTPEERTLLAYAPAYITYLQGLRFLTDHLNRDRYYPVRYFGHNLVRAAVQFTLLKGIDDKADQILEFIDECCQ